MSKKSAVATEIVMKASALRSRLESLIRAVSTKPTIPVLQYLRVEPRDGGLRLCATNLDIAVSVDLDCAGQADEPFLVPAKRLVDFVKWLADDAELLIAVDKSTIRVQSGSYDGKWQTLPAAEFPIIHQPESGVSIVLKAAVLRAQIACVERCTREEDTRHFLCGARLLIEQGELSLVATDGHRLGIATVPTDATDASLLIPRMGLSPLKAFIADVETVTLTEDERFLFFAAYGWLLSVRRVDGNFPNHTRVIPANPPLKASVDREPLIAAVNRVIAVVDPTGENRLRRISLTLCEKAIEVSGQSPEGGHAHERVSADGPAKDLKLDFDARYVLDFLSTATTEQISVRGTTEADATLWEPVGDMAVSYSYVLMPMR